MLRTDERRMRARPEDSKRANCTMECDLRAASLARVATWAACGSAWTAPESKQSLRLSDLRNWVVTYMGLGASKTFHTRQGRREPLSLINCAGWLQDNVSLDASMLGGSTQGLLCWSKSCSWLS